MFHLNILWEATYFLKNQLYEILSEIKSWRLIPMKLVKKISAVAQLQQNQIRKR